MYIWRAEGQKAAGTADRAKSLGWSVLSLGGFQGADSTATSSGNKRRSVLFLGKERQILFLYIYKATFGWVAAAAWQQPRGHRSVLHVGCPFS